MYDERVLTKNKMIQHRKELEKTAKDNVTKIKQLEYAITAENNNQMAKKIALNSCYGALGNQWFRYFNRDIAEVLQHLVN